ncbi:plasma membrane calcium [Mycoemilia scoparia]|uniref:Plasma membrane calcium n=1 Tax=Mycoemilia scoparia TaxID=417184 RepID=A0A9W8DR45_9FUNG|nr:plasma membrane calcium [Mycoemilia scoparia]
MPLFDFQRRAMGYVSPFDSAISSTEGLLATASQQSQEALSPSAGVATESYRHHQVTVAAAGPTKTAKENVANSNILSVNTMADAVVSGAESMLNSITPQILQDMVRNRDTKVFMQLGGISQIEQYLHQQQNNSGKFKWFHQRHSQARQNIDEEAGLLTNHLQSTSTSKHYYKKTKAGLHRIIKFLKEMLNHRPVVMLIMVSLAALLIDLFNKNTKHCNSPEHREDCGEDNQWIQDVGVIVGVGIIRLVNTWHDMQVESYTDLISSKSAGKEKTVKVRRNERWINVLKSQVVAGDVVQIEAGDFIDADGVIIESHDLVCQEVKPKDGENVSNPSPPNTESGAIDGHQDSGDGKNPNQRTSNPSQRKNRNSDDEYDEDEFFDDNSDQWIEVSKGLIDHGHDGFVIKGSQVVRGLALMLVISTNDPSPPLPKLSSRKSHKYNSDDNSVDSEDEDSRHKYLSKLKRSVLDRNYTEQFTAISKRLAKYVFWIVVGLTTIYLLKWTLKLGIDLDIASPGVIISQVLSMLIECSVLLVIAAPSRIPLSLTAKVASTVAKYTEKGSLTLKLAACELMGSATSICANIEALISGPMVVDFAYIAEHTLVDRNSMIHMLTQSPPKQALRLIIQGMAINNAATRVLNDAGEREYIGSSDYECALLKYLDSDLEIDFEIIRKEYPALRVFPFTPESKAMATVVQRRSAANQKAPSVRSAVANSYHYRYDGNGGRVRSNSSGSSSSTNNNSLQPASYRIHIKGAPEVLLDSCSFYLNRHGKKSIMTPAARQHILTKLKELTRSSSNNPFSSQTISSTTNDRSNIGGGGGGAISSGKKVLGFAQKCIDLFDPTKITSTEACLASATWIGFVGMSTAIKPEVHSAVQECGELGVAVRLVTGESLETSTNIAREVGILALPPTVNFRRNVYGNYSYTNLTSTTGGGIINSAITEIPLNRDPYYHNNNNNTNSGHLQDTRKGSQLAIEARDWNKIIDNPRWREESESILDDLRVLARCTANDKRKLVELLQNERDEIVVLTGKHLSDVKALELADVGFSLGYIGNTRNRRSKLPPPLSINKKQKQRLVLFDDQFVSIVQIIKWGRLIYHHSRITLQFQLTTGLTLLLTFMLSVITLIARFPIDNGDKSGGGGEDELIWILGPVEFLWIYFITDTLASTRLLPNTSNNSLSQKQTRPPLARNGSSFSGTITRFLPVPRKGPLLDSLLLFKIFGHGILQFLLILTIRLFPETFIGPLETNTTTANTTMVVQTYVFNLLIFLQLFYQFCCHTHALPNNLTRESSSSSAAAAAAPSSSTITSSKNKNGRNSMIINFNSSSSLLGGGDTPEILEELYKPITNSALNPKKVLKDAFRSLVIIPFTRSTTTINSSGTQVNRKVYLVSGLIITAQVLVIMFGSTMFGITRLTPTQWLSSAALSLLVFPIDIVLSLCLVGVEYLKAVWKARKMRGVKLTHNTRFHHHDYDYHHHYSGRGSSGAYRASRSADNINSGTDQNNVLKGSGIKFWNRMFSKSHDRVIFDGYGGGDSSEGQSIGPLNHPVVDITNSSIDGSSNSRQLGNSQQSNNFGILPSTSSYSHPYCTQSTTIKYSNEADPLLSSLSRSH